MSGPARRRAFWVPDRLWQEAMEVAERRGDSLAEVLREALRRYVRRNR